MVDLIKIKLPVLIMSHGPLCGHTFLKSVLRLQVVTQFGFKLNIKIASCIVVTVKPVASPERSI